MKILVTTDDFDAGREIVALKDQKTNVGAIATFIGTVRDIQANSQVNELILEHYPEMTQQVLREIVHQAVERWHLSDVTVIHRVGTLLPNEQIVFVGVACSHRKEAFLACEYIIDVLKTRAPFWKKERTDTSEHWVDAQHSDEQASNQWLETDSKSI